MGQWRWMAGMSLGVGCVIGQTADPPPLGTEPHGTESTLTDPGACADALPVRRSWDADAADRGERLFVDGTLGTALFPSIGLRTLWAVWGTGPLLDDATYWAEFRSRYGLLEAPWPNDGYPLGLHAIDANTATLNCLMCHADQVAGEPVIGVGNSRLDFQGLVDDLIALAAVAESMGLPTIELPYSITDRTGAAGTVDGVGLGMQVSLLYGPPGADIETHFGVQQAAPWWTLKHKDHTYADGSGDVDNHRTMASTLLAFGTPWDALQALEPDLEDLLAMMGSLQAPAWPFAVDTVAADTGRPIYQARCAACHGDVCDPAVGYADVIVPTAEVGTDPLRESRWTQDEATWANASWFGQAGAMRDTSGYQANPLVGVWASAPYLHNGSVPDLAALLDSSTRPESWQRTGADRADYDPERVGWRYTEPTPPSDRDTVESRKVYDTLQPGASSAGHVYGDDLSDGQRSDLIEFLKTL